MNHLFADPADYTRQPNADTAALTHLPGDYGTPVLGAIPALFRDFYGAIEKRHQKYGAVSKINLGFKPGVLVLGPDLFKQILLDPERNFSNRMGYDHVTGEWFGGGIMFRDFDEHRIHRRVFQTAFKSDAMRGYVPMMNGLMQQHLAHWGEVADFRFVPHIQALLMAIGARVFYGVEDLDGKAAQKMGEAFLKVINRGMRSLVKINCPPLSFYYGQQGKKYIVDYIGSRITERRAADGKDFMSYLVKEKKDDGEYLTDQELIAHLSFLFFAAYDTTTTALSHLMMHLALDPDLQERLRKQSLALGKPLADFDDLDQLTEIDHAFHESLRLYPSASIFMRRSLRACELGGKKIPANTILFLVPMFNHRMEQWWDNPQKFDPDRFAKGREEHKRHPFSYAPFGGGAHKCIGMNFAQLNAKLFMHQLLLKYRFRVPAGYTAKSQTLPLPKPAKDLPLFFERINFERI